MSLPFPVHQFGDPDASTLILLHPGGVGHAVWLPFIQTWSKQFHVLVPDLIPKGARPVSLQGTADGVVAILEKQHNPVWLVGASLGANVALLVAAQIPERVAGLVIDSAQVGGPPPALLPWLIWFLQGVTHLVPQPIITALMMRQFAGYNDSDRVAIRGEVEQNGKLGFWEQVKAHFAYDVRSLLPRVTVPTLIIAGEQDMLTKSGEPQKLQAGIPQAVVHVIPQAGHVTFLRQPTCFHQLVTSFLASGGKRNS